MTFEENDAALIRSALNDVARQGHDRGGGGEQDHAAGALRYLIGALGPNGNMTLETLLGVLRAMGVRLSVRG